VKIGEDFKIFKLFEKEPKSPNSTQKGIQHPIRRKGKKISLLGSMFNLDALTNNY
jgi:hypothetical protein